MTGLDAIRAVLTDPRDVLGRLGVDTSSARDAGDGADLTMRCLAPGHADRTPSMSVFRVDGTIGFRCYSCGAKGDLFSLVAMVRGLDTRLDFPEVVRAAAQLAGVQLGASAPRPVDPVVRLAQVIDVMADRWLSGRHWTGALSVAEALADGRAADGDAEARELLADAKRLDRVVAGAGIAAIGEALEVLHEVDAMAAEARQIAAALAWLPPPGARRVAAEVDAALDWLAPEILSSIHVREVLSVLGLDGSRCAA